MEEQLSPNDLSDAVSAYREALTEEDPDSLVVSKKISSATFAIWTILWRGDTEKPKIPTPEVLKADITSLTEAFPKSKDFNEESERKLSTLIGNLVIARKSGDSHRFVETLLSIFGIKTSYFAVERNNIPLNTIEQALLLPRFKTQAVIETEEDSEAKLNESFRITAAIRTYGSHPLHENFSNFSERILDLGSRIADELPEELSTLGIPVAEEMIALMQATTRLPDIDAQIRQKSRSEKGRLQKKSERYDLGSNNVTTIGNNPSRIRALEEERRRLQEFLLEYANWEKAEFTEHILSKLGLEVWTTEEVIPEIHHIKVLSRKKTIQEALRTSLLYLAVHVNSDFRKFSESTKKARKILDDYFRINQSIHEKIAKKLAFDNEMESLEELEASIEDLKQLTSNRKYEHIKSALIREVIQKYVSGSQGKKTA